VKNCGNKKKDCGDSDIFCL